MASKNLLPIVMFLGLTAASVIITEPVMDSTCGDKSFCIYRPQNYPQVVIDSLLEEANWRQIDTQTPEYRFSEENNVCKTLIPNPSQVHVLKDAQGDLRYVVQSKKFKQIVRIVECEQEGRINENTNTKILLQMDLMLNETTLMPVGCLQGTTDFKFLVLRKDFKGFEVATPLGGIPTCCSFVYYKH